MSFTFFTFEHCSDIFHHPFFRSQLTSSDPLASYCSKYMFLAAKFDRERRNFMFAVAANCYQSSGHDNSKVNEANS